MLRSSGAFKFEEIDELVENGCLNGLFVLSRAAGFIGHYLDQKRMAQPLYRHPWDDITYILAEDGAQCERAEISKSAGKREHLQAPRTNGAARGSACPCQ